MIARQIRSVVSPRSMMILFCVTVLALLSAGRAQADTIDSFTYTFAGNTFTWQLPASPTVASNEFELGTFFAILGVPYSENGVAATTPGEFDFFAAGQMGGLQLFLSADNSVPINAYGAQLYQGPESAPTFVANTYMLNNNDASGPLGTLVITAPPVDTPEPSSGLLLGAGLIALLGTATLRRRVCVASSCAVS